jgi:hypothetical protein
MKRMLFLMVFGCCSLQQICAFPWDTSSLQKLAKEMAQVLAEEVGGRSHRRGVTLEVNFQQGEGKVMFALAPRDERDTLFSLTISAKEKGYLVQGNFFSHLEMQRVEKVVKVFLDKHSVSWEMRIATLSFGVVKVACADLYVEPRCEAGDNLGSQLLYGAAVTIIATNHDNKFVRVQTEKDGYLGWLATDTIVVVTPEAWQIWVHMPKVCLKVAAAELPAASDIGLRSDGKLWKFPAEVYITLPDAQVVLPVVKATPQNLLTTARRFLPQGDLGPITYLWGGTAVPKLDCSGFVQMVFRLNNVLLPRDADQQYQYSMPAKREDMLPADLIFFGKRQDHPTHVGIHIGDGVYIHCSPSGDYSGVKLNRLHGDSEYEKYLNGIYWGAGRILGR